MHAAVGVVGLVLEEAREVGVAADQVDVHRRGVARDDQARRHVARGRDAVVQARVHEPHHLVRRGRDPRRDDAARLVLERGDPRVVGIAGPDDEVQASLAGADRGRHRAAGHHRVGGGVGRRRGRGAVAGDGPEPAGSSPSPHAAAASATAHTTRVPVTQRRCIRGFLLARFRPQPHGRPVPRPPRFPLLGGESTGCVSAALRSRPAPRRRSRSAGAACARPAGRSGTPRRRGGRRRTRRAPRGRTRPAPRGRRWRPGRA